MKKKFSAGLMFSLRAKIIIIICAIVLLSAASFSVFTYVRAVETGLNAGKEALAGEARLLALRLKGAYERMEQDLNLVSVAPSMRDVIENERGLELALQDSDQAEMQREHLASLFYAIMTVRPEYTQMRLIGVADNGRELVRVDRNSDSSTTGLVRIPDSKLQEKSKEPYFQHVLAHGGHGVDFSDVTYNRENGKIVTPRVATIRALLPIYNTQDELLGMIVANTDYEKLLSKAFLEAAQKKSIFVIDGAGDYLEYKTGGKISELEFRDNYSKPPPWFVPTILNGNTAEGVLTDEHNISYFVPMSANEDNLHANRFLVLQVSRNTLLSAAYETRRESLFLMSVLLLSSLFIAAVASKVLTDPLARLTQKIKDSKENNQPLKLSISSNDEIGEMAGAFQELTDSLVESELKIRSVISNIGEGIIIIDEQGIIDSFNPACERIFQYSAQEVLGKSISMLMPAPNRGNHDRYLKRYEVTGERKIDWTGRIETGQHKDGTTFEIELSITELDFEGRHMFVGIIRDISERQMVEKTKSEFISTVSHELRTPLTSIKGSLGLMRSGVLGSLSEQQQKMLNIAYDNCESLTELINDILDIEKISSGKIELVKEPTDLSLLISNAVEAYKAYAEEHGVTFVYSGTAKPVMVRGDQSRLMQVMANLMSNAAKFSSTGGEVQISLSRHKDRARISVKDYGCGIPEEARATIFEKFTQADSSDKRNKGGTGLGLSIAKHIVEQHGGTIGFTSQVGLGTTFNVDLPELAADLLE